MKLSCVPRDVTGTGVSRRLRSNDFIPGVIYGRAVNPLNISINKKDLVKAIKENGENALLDIELQGKSYYTMIKDVQRDYVKDIILHVDFQQISKTQKVQVLIPIHLLNTSVVQNEGALVHQMDQLSIECIPDQIPKSITLDVSELKVGHGLTVEQIQVDEGIKILNDKDEVIVSLSPLRVSEETEEESEDAENAEPVVIGSENKEE
jgi:large subunit ribosomal protein L25